MQRDKYQDLFKKFDGNGYLYQIFTASIYLNNITIWSRTRWYFVNTYMPWKKELQGLFNERKSKFHEML